MRRWLHPEQAADQLGQLRVPMPARQHLRGDQRDARGPVLQAERLHRGQRPGQRLLQPRHRLGARAEEQLRRGLHAHGRQPAQPGGGSRRVPGRVGHHALCLHTGRRGHCGVRKLRRLALPGARVLARRRYPGRVQRPLERAAGADLRLWPVAHQHSDLHALPEQEHEHGAVQRLSCPGLPAPAARTACPAGGAAGRRDEVPGGVGPRYPAPGERQRPDVPSHSAARRAAGSHLSGASSGHPRGPSHGDHGQPGRDGGLRRCGPGGRGLGRLGPRHDPPADERPRNPSAAEHRGGGHRMRGEEQVPRAQLESRTAGRAWAVRDVHPRGRGRRLRARVLQAEPPPRAAHPRRHGPERRRHHADPQVLRSRRALLLPPFRADLRRPGQQDRPRRRPLPLVRDGPAHLRRRRSPDLRRRRLRLPDGHLLPVPRHC